MIGVENNILPHSRAVVENDNGLEEERRLCYVGMTRAKKLLYITYCKKRHSFGQFGNAVQRPAYPSLFLRETGLIKENNG
jgi:superfamily I DNA/RNA helicase